MKARVVVVGSSNTDMIIQLERIPRPGETILGGRFASAAGGKGANQAVGAARAGGQVTFIARVGTDAFGDQAIAGWTRDGIGVDHVSRDARRPSGVALIFVAESGENSIAVASGANAGLAPADVRRAASTFVPGGVVLLQLETPLPTVAAAAALGAARGMRVILNPAPARRLPASLLRQVSVLTPNETEAECLSGIAAADPAGVKAAAAALLSQGVSTVVLTLGARGAFVATRDPGSVGGGMELMPAPAGKRGFGWWAQWIPGFKVKAVDTTAAGDVFNGALAVALGEGKALAEAVRFANAAGALAVMRLGAQPSAPRRREIERLLRSGSARR